MATHIRCENAEKAESYVLDNIMEKYLDTIYFGDDVISYRDQYPWIHPGNEMCFMHTERIYVYF